MYDPTTRPHPPQPWQPSSRKRRSPRHIRKAVTIRITAALAAAALAALAAAGCSATTSHAHKTAAALSAVTTAKACRDLAAWENGSSSGGIETDTKLVNELENVSDSNLGVDSTKWINEIKARGSNMAAWADNVGSDCQQAGVPKVLNGGTSLATTAPAPSPQVTDPSGNTCSSLDSQGYCPGNDPVTMTRQTDTVVFKVWGSGQPSVQYGTDSSTSNPGSLGPLGDGNALPWEGSMPYNSVALYYAVTAQLEGWGSVSDSVTEVVTTTCSGQAPKTESFTLATGQASGGYAIATAEYASGDTGNVTQAQSDAGC